MSVGWRQGARVAVRLGLALLGLPAGRAEARHERGTVTVSPGFSLARTANYRKTASVEYAWDGERLLETRTEKDEHYTDWDLMASLSAGYFVIDRLEAGVTASGIMTFYSGTNHSDFSVYDAKLYLKRYFDNTTSLTPYVKVAGGGSWIDTGDYHETDMTVEGVLGVEVFGAGNFSVFAELSTAYTFLSESLRGTEWKQQVYLGVTWFLWPGQRAARRATPLSTLDRATRRLIDRTSRHWDSRLEALDQQIERERTVPSE